MFLLVALLHPLTDTVSSGEYPAQLKIQNLYLNALKDLNGIK